MATLVSTGSPTGKMSRKPTPTAIKVREESDGTGLVIANTLTVCAHLFHLACLAHHFSQAATGNSHSTASHRPSYNILQSDKLSNIQAPKHKEKV
jgi:hypothetical protein